MKTKKLWFSAAVNLLGLLFLVLILKPCFEMNDDSTIYELTGGAKGVYDAHGVFLHLFLGQAMKLLSGLFPGIQWYTALQYAVLFCSFTAVFYVLMNRMKPAMAAASFGVLFFYFGYEGYIILQFSKTSGIASCAGIFLMFHGLEQKKKNWLCVSCGLLLALVGGMYRYKEFLMCAAVMSSLGVYTLFRLNWKRSRELFYTVLAYLGSFLLLFGSFGGLLLIQSFAYEKDEAWGEYLRYNDSRSSLMDYGFPDYDTFQEEYEKLGLSREDIELYRSGNYADSDLFDSEAIETLLSLRPKKELNRSFLLDYFDTLSYPGTADDSFLQEAIDLFDANDEAFLSSEAWSTIYQPVINGTGGLFVPEAIASIADPQKMEDHSDTRFSGPAGGELDLRVLYKYMDDDQTRTGMFMVWCDGKWARFDQGETLLYDIDAQTAVSGDCTLELPEEPGDYDIFLLNMKLNDPEGYVPEYVSCYTVEVR